MVSITLSRKVLLELAIPRSHETELPLSLPLGYSFSAEWPQTLAESEVPQISSHHLGAKEKNSEQAQRGLSSHDIRIRHITLEEHSCPNLRLLHRHRGRGALQRHFHWERQELGQVPHTHVGCSRCSVFSQKLPDHPGPSDPVEPRSWFPESERV